MSKFAKILQRLDTDLYNLKPELSFEYQPNTRREGGDVRLLRAGEPLTEFMSYKEMVIYVGGLFEGINYG